MKYAVICVSNGNFSVVSEFAEKDKAIVNFHATCTNLWNAPDVVSACVVVVNEKMQIVKIEYIHYDD